MSKKEKYPKLLYVVHEKQSDGTTFLMHYDDINDLAVVGEAVQVAVYERKEVRMVVAKAELVRP
jgi:hypothetical protein